MEVCLRCATGTVDEIDVSGIPIHDVAGALKLYLRHQVEPLVPFELFDPVCNAFCTPSSIPKVECGGGVVWR